MTTRSEPSRSKSGALARTRPSRRALPWAAALLLLVGPRLVADTIAVPAQVATIQGALDMAQDGDRVEVAAGTYFEKIIFPRSGTAGAPITLEGAAGSRPILDGTGVSGDNMVLMEDRSHLRIRGFEIRNNLGVNDGSGIRILGSGSDLEIDDNIIHEIRGDDAMGITVYGTDPQPIDDLRITNNQIYDCDPARSEALVLNGNVSNFLIEGNLVRDVNNIGIDMIGGETDIQPDPSLVVRQGVVRGNTVLRANSIYDGGYAGGIYVDGGRDIVIENNFVGGCDLGIEIGAENSGLVTENVTVRNNLIAGNEKVGIVFGGFAAAVGRANNNVFRGNTLYKNNTVGKSGQGTHFPGGGIGEIWIQFAADNVLANNLVVAGPENVFVGSFDAGSSVGNSFDYNLYFSADGAEVGDFSLNGTGYFGFTEWQTDTGNDGSSLTEDPQLVDGDGGDLHLSATSPAIDGGDPGYLPEAGERDLDGAARRVGIAVDIGADERPQEALFRDGFESGDALAWSAAVP